MGDENSRAGQVPSLTLAQAARPPAILLFLALA